MNIYIASPLFHKWEQRNVKHIEKWLKTIFRGATIYCPQDFQVPQCMGTAQSCLGKENL